MRSKGTIEQQIKALERSIETFGDQPQQGQTKGPKLLAIESLKTQGKNNG